MVDVNCPWTVQESLRMAEAFAPYDIYWLEEPVWPPEDCPAIAAVRAAGGVGIAAGECLGSPESIAAMLAAGAVDVVQPSVTKVGGLSALLEVRDLAMRHGAAMVPHCPYFGPGLLATLHLLAAAEVEEPLEYYFADLEAPPYPALVPRDGFVAVPQAPGLGLEIDPALLATAV